MFTETPWYLSKETMLDKRAAGFRKIFSYLEERYKARDAKTMLIIETGSLREPGNWSGDGQSTVLFDRFLQFINDGLFTSIDNDRAVLEIASQYVSRRTHLIEGDSVKLLLTYSQAVKTIVPIDCLYFDSFNVEWNNPLPAAIHHMKELLSIMPRLVPGTLIVVDDNIFNGQQLVGKGMLIADYMQHLGIEPFHVGYQMAWIWK